MAYQFWPSGVAPYSAYTYITDRTTPLNHDSIMNGIARDVGWIQHNINTTHLFASGYARPSLSGFFRNIDTNYLYVNNLQTRNLVFNNIKDPRFSSLKISGSIISVIDSAFKNNDITVSDTFKSTIFFLNASGLVYNPISISGGVYDYYMTSGFYNFLDGLFGNITISNGNLVVDKSHKILIENLGLFSPSGSISESGIIWNSTAGHNHINNKINSTNIISGSINYNEDLVINNVNSSIDIISGVLDAEYYETQTSYDVTEFYELEFSKDGIYTCDQPNLSGYVRDLDIGSCSMLSYNGRVYAASTSAPSGSKNLTDTYIYNTDDFYNWRGVLVSGSWRPDNSSDVSGIASIDSMTMFTEQPHVLWNLKVSDSNYVAVLLATDPTDAKIQYNSGNYSYGSSRYGLGLSVIENNLLVFGYEYPHRKNNGIPQWDRKYIGYSVGFNIDDTNASDQDVSYKGVEYKYTYPFVQIFTSAGFGVNYEQKFWLDGSIGTGSVSREPFYTSAINGNVYDYISKEAGSPTGYFGGFFGNGFSEITSVFSTELPYHNGQRGVSTNFASGKNKYEDLITNYAISPILFFGNSTTYVHTSLGSGIFGGCLPLVLNVDKRMLPPNSPNSVSNTDIYITSGNAEFAPGFLHGGRSMLDSSTLLFRIPGDYYWSRIRSSNLFLDLPNNIARLWTTDQFASTRTELINMCPWSPGLLVTPFGGSGQLYYKNENDDSYFKISYSDLSSSGIVIPPNTFEQPRNYPTYFNRPVKDGFWKSKYFNWYYESPIPANTNPPSGTYPKTCYYMRPKCPVQHNGVIYTILEHSTGFVYIGSNGSQFIDDDIYYSDLIKFGNVIYGVGIKDNNIIVVTLKRNISTPVSITSSSSGSKDTPKFIAHGGKLYLGVGNGKFLVKKPSHLDLCITTNL